MISRKPTALDLAKRLRKLSPLLGKKALAQGLALTVPVLDRFLRQEVPSEMCTHPELLSRLAALEEASAPALLAREAEKRARRETNVRSFNEGVMRRLNEGPEAE